jgi:DNA polymerase elongation subunit (family B)
MSEFYTSVSRFGNQLLYRGYQDGKRVQRKIKYCPTYFVSTNKPTDWKALDGTPVAPLQMDSMRDAKDWVETNRNVVGRHIFGNDRHVATYLNEKFPGTIDFDPSIINITAIDIEVASDDGFPHPEEAAREVISIALINNIDNTYYVWGLDDFDTESSYMRENRVIYKQFSTEAELLMDFIDFWSNPVHTPDIVTGWNSEFFDIPYLLNRTLRIFGEDTAKRFSPWNKIDRKDITVMGRNQMTFNITGIISIDYLEAFKKFGYSYGAQESYKLDHIASVVLGEKKLSYEEHGNLFTLYKEDHQKFIDYNIRDVELIRRFEDKMGLIQLCMTIAYKAGVNYGETFGTTSIWDTIIYRELHANNVIVPFADEKIKTPYPGGYVKEPQVGMHDWVLSFDLASLYPSIIMQYNMSPETIAEGEVTQFDINKVLNREQDIDNHGKALAASGQYFETDKQGVLPSIISGMYTERVGIKRQMLDAQQELQHVDKSNKQETYRIERDISKAENSQMAIKILLNSLYGALGNKYFRFFDQRIAESITYTGQLTIQWAEKAINDWMNDLLKTENDKDYVIAIDTDSVYVNLGPLVEKVKPKNPVNFLDSAAKEVIEPLLEKAYAELYSTLGGYENRMAMDREVIADRGIWTAKKRYILNVHDNEGVRYAEPKMKIMGIEAIKSSTPAPCREALTELFKLILSSDEDTTQNAIATFKSHFNTLPANEIAFPRGVTDINKWKDPYTVYKKSTPQHVRASLIHNKMITDLDLHRQYQPIAGGNKIRFVALKLPNPAKQDVIAFSDYLPKEFGLDKFVNYDLQFHKSFIKPIEPVLAAIGWSVEPRSDLSDFFS